MPWQEILTAFALVLVIEGILPFVGPGRYRQMVAQIAPQPTGLRRNRHAQDCLIALTVRVHGKPGATAT